MTPPSIGRSSNQEWLDLERDRDRERRIVELRAQGLTYEVIAARFGVSPSRVGQIVKRAKREAERT